jgi:hypothetical protein
MHMPQIAAKARHARQSVQSQVQRDGYAVKGEGITFAERPLPGAFGAEDAGAGAIITSWLEEGGMGKWLISAALLGILAIAFWASYGLWIRVVASVPAWVWLLLAIGGGLSIALGAGLMALVFYSNRMGFDEPPVIVEPGHESRR